MAIPAKSSKITESVRRELEIATAVGRERLWTTHVTYALELIEHAHGQVTPTRALGIYLRVHDVPEHEAGILTHRVLVTLGQQPAADRPAEPTPAETTPADDEAEDPHSLVARIQKRLRGRVNLELRRWVELQTGRAEVALLKIHVDNALRFIEILKPESSYAEAVQLYVEMIGVRKSWGEMIYFFTLDQLSELSAAVAPDHLLANPERPALPPFRESPLRIVESGG